MAKRKNSDGLGAEFFDLVFGGGEDREERLVPLKKAIDMADSANDLRAGMLARIEYLRITEFTGRYDESIVAFAWCLGVCEKDPKLLEQFSDDILWIFKWITGSISRYSSISRRQIQDTYQQMSRYYERAGLSFRAIYGLRAANCIDLGDIDQIPALQAQWQAAPKDGSEDCAACEAGNLLAEYLALRDFDKAFETSRPLLKGRLTCSVQPQAAQTMMLMPLFRQKKWALADQAQRTAAPKVLGDPNHFDDMGLHAGFLALTDQLTQAVAMLEAGLAHLPHVRRPWDQMIFFKGARLLLRRLADIGHKQIKLRIPAAVDFHRPDNTYPVPHLLQLIDQRGRQIAADFDARNNNHFVSSRFTEWDELLIQIHPLTKKKD